MGWFENLSTREKILILCALPIVVLGGGYQFAWTPLMQSRAAYLDQIANYHLLTETATRVQQTPAEQVRPAQSPAATDPLSSRVTESVTAANLQLRRIETLPNGVRVTLDDADFSQIILWLGELETQDRITIRAIELDRRTTPGAVSARIILADLP